MHSVYLSKSAFFPQTVPITYTWLSNIRAKMASLSNFGGQYIYQDNDFEDTEYNRVCSNQMDVTMKSFLVKMTLMTLSAFVAGFGPIRAYVLYGIRTTTLEVRIPFTEPKSNAEFLGNLLLQFIVLFHGILGYVGAEVWMSLVENIVSISPALFKLEMKRLCEEYKTKATSVLELHSRFRHLVVQSLDADR